MAAFPSAHFQTTTAELRDYQGRTFFPDDNSNFTVFHMVELRHLVAGHERAPGSLGILVDGFMRYGIVHGDGIGVYGYASEPRDLFKNGDGWVFLELKVRPHLTKIKHGSPGRYVLKSDQENSSIGGPCPDCEIVALHHMYRSLPEFLKL